MIDSVGFMENQVKQPAPEKPLRILLVGNNPIELGRLRELLKQIPGYRVMAEIAFDVRSAWARMLRFTPNFVLIDDNIGRRELAEAVSLLANRRKTRHVPVAVLKNSNYTEVLPTSAPLDYLLKQNLTPQALYMAVKNALKLQQARKYLAQAYARRKKQLLRFIS
jgi:DNA-binding NarL/FixJ family response regulator